MIFIIAVLAFAVGFAIIGWGSIERDIENIHAKEKL